MAKPDVKNGIGKIIHAIKPVTTSVPIAHKRTREHPEIKRVDVSRLDAQTRAIYKRARAAASEHEEKVASSGDGMLNVVLRRPFQFGFVTTLGVLLALTVGTLIEQASTVIIYVAAALFIALGLDPIVRSLERRNVKRGWAIAVVFLGFIGLLALCLSIVIPVVVQQVTLLVQTAPFYISDVAQEQWFKRFNSNFQQYINFEDLLSAARAFVSDKSNWVAVAGGILQVASEVASAVTAITVVLILTLYFLSSMRAIKRGFYALVPLSKRARVIDITEQVADSVGAYITGQALIALANAVCGFIAMSVIGVPFAAVLAVCAFLLALIPLVGSLTATVLITLVALFESPGTALAIGIYYLIYMQLEAYVLGPRVMSRAVSVPGAFVVIGALTGGVLLGLLGALVAIPVTASVLMIIKQVWVPYQDER